MNCLKIDQVDFYEIRHQDEIDKLLFDFDHAENLPANKLPNTQPPGTLQSVTYDFGREASRYYAIRTIVTSSGIEVVRTQILMAITEIFWHAS